MKIKFDGKQQYQLDAVNSIVDIFQGQAFSESSFEIGLNDGKTKLWNDLIVSNNLSLEEKDIFNNIKSIQERNNIAYTDSELSVYENDSKKSLRNGMNFSVEMETGTGKTYVYLRTIHELHKKYGFKKFIIVVPSVAIREGVIKNLEITKDHFASIYDNPEMDFFVYDSRKRGLIKSFATNNSLQIMVINIDSFRSKDKNIIHQNSDWGIPVEYLRATNPILIMDEPQNMETDKSKEAIAEFNPLCTFRYSATHKELYNQMYRLNPVDAYDLGLVKRIEVDSVMMDDGFAGIYVKLKKIEFKNKKPVARIEIDCNTKSGLKRKEIIVSSGDDLFIKSGELEKYKDFVVDEMEYGDNAYVQFTNGLVLKEGGSNGGMNDDIVKVMIRRTIENHLDKEKELSGQGIKILSLFFIDRVANYRDHDKNEKGKFALWFEEAYEELTRLPKYKDFKISDISLAHNGYFSKDKKGNAKDTKGNTKEDDDTYELIMKDKERLLSFDTPLRFIFSHSALREGWDNPNVFQICTLNQTNSEIKKRQEIGRGLRLPVNQDGERLFDNSKNILTVVANENYEDFAKKLQTEYEEDCGINFSGRIKDKRKRKKITLKKNFELDENFKMLWDKIKAKTVYHVFYSTEELIRLAAEKIAELDIKKASISITKTELDISEAKVGYKIKNSKTKAVSGVRDIFLPDILLAIQKKTKLTKHTILEIIKKFGKMEAMIDSPQQFVEDSSKEINFVLNNLLVDGIKYEKIAGENWEMKEFENEELSSYLDNVFAVSKQEKTLTDYVIYDSEVENEFVKELENREDVLFYVKLPAWFKIKTPIGGYNPDWAIMFEDEGEKKLYFVVETKGAERLEELSLSEQIKIKCGRKYFNEFEDVDYKWGKDLRSLK